ncbi:centromere protein K isoform X1 [Bubalus kerabau]|uniref:centromere protein K isoform X1 n=1 Tax=Bubalus carabanensis TaxID=3119969 RepID=UPI00244E8EF7|nr:centromere protein K isoform X1 [Bubalus carabanensis]XP_055410442.1 centromere protein K isoform X1 [Bubalus carabanensis]
MSLNQQDLDPDSTTDVEDVADAEEELIKKCEEMWKDMEECQNKLSLTGTETLTDSNAQLSLLIMQVKCLTAELSQWQKETPEMIPLNEEILVTLGKEEFQKLRHDLELVLSTIQSNNEKLKEDLEREQKWLDEQQQILESLNVLQNELKQQVVTFSESRIFNELKTKMRDIKEFKEKLLVTLGEFLEDHFPLPDRNVKKKKKNIQESTAQLITLHEMLEGIFPTQGSNPRLLHCRQILYCYGPCYSMSIATAAAAKLLQSCLTLCDPIDGSPPGSPVPGILQARTLEWVAISFSNA